MDYNKELNEINKKILSIKNFNTEDFIWNYKRMINSIYHFHNVIGKNAKCSGDLSKIKYNLKGMMRPQSGDVCYIYIENSYPKEIFNSHWCLIIKDFGNTMLVVPMVSIKQESAQVDKTCEMIVKIKDFEEDGCSKLKIHQMFCADIMRINPTKKHIRFKQILNMLKTKSKKSQICLDSILYINIY